MPSETVHIESRFAEILLPEVLVSPDGDCWRVQAHQGLLMPFAGQAKARLMRSAYAVGEVRDGMLLPDWIWSVRADEIGNDEMIHAVEEVV